MTTEESKLDKTARETIIKELEKFKANKNDNRKLMLLIGDEEHTTILSYKFDARGALWATAQALSATVEQINQTWRQSQGMDSK